MHATRTIHGAPDGHLAVMRHQHAAHHGIIDPIDQPAQSSTARESCCSDCRARLRPAAGLASSHVLATFLLSSPAVMARITPLENTGSMKANAADHHVAFAPTGTEPVGAVAAVITSDAFSAVSSCADRGASGGSVEQQIVRTADGALS